MGTQGYIPQLTKKCYSLLFTVIWALIWPQTVAQVLRCRASSQPAVLLILPRVLDQFLLHCGALSLCSQLHKLTSCQLPFASCLLWWMDGFLQAAFGDASSSVRHQTHLLETTDPFQICFFFWTVSHKSYENNSTAQSCTMLFFTNAQMCESSSYLLAPHLWAIMVCWQNATWL